VFYKREKLAVSKQGAEPVRVMRRLGIALALVLGVFVVLAAGAFRELTGGTMGAGDKAATLSIDGRTRDYFVHGPRGYDGKAPLPVVFVLHGATQSAASAERMSGMSTEADSHNFLAVYPTGTGHLPSWNAGACCSYAMRNNVDDMAFFRALIDRLEKDYAVDPKRIYFTGISNGAMMSFRLACEMSDKVAAIAPVEGSQDIPCHPSSAVSVLMFHGTADRLVPYNGGSTAFQMGSKRSDTPVADTIAFWAKQDGCQPTPDRKTSGVLKTDIYSGCANGAGVTLQTIEGGRHMWPGLRISGNDIPATSMIWSFFAAHPKA
jgi:polyhydroxybutyrate depolymerase